MPGWRPTCQPCSQHKGDKGTARELCHQLESGIANAPKPKKEAGSGTADHLEDAVHADGALRNNSPLQNEGPITPNAVPSQLHLLVQVLSSFYPFSTLFYSVQPHQFCPILTRFYPILYPTTRFYPAKRFTTVLPHS